MRSFIFHSRLGIVTVALILTLGWLVATGSSAFALSSGIYDISTGGLSGWFEYDETGGAGGSNYFKTWDLTHNFSTLNWNSTTDTPIPVNSQMLLETVSSVHFNTLEFQLLDFGPGTTAYNATLTHPSQGVLYFTEGGYQLRAIPIPSTMIMMLIGLPALAAARWWSTRQQGVA